MLPLIAGLALIMSKMLAAHGTQPDRPGRVSDLNSVLTENIRGTSTIRGLGVHTARERTSQVNKRQFATGWAWCAIRQLALPWTRYQRLDPHDSVHALGRRLHGSQLGKLGRQRPPLGHGFQPARILADMLNHHVSSLRIMLVNMGRVFGVVSLAKKQRQRGACTAPKRSPPCLTTVEEPGVRRDCTGGNLRLLAGRPELAKVSA